MSIAGQSRRVLIVDDEERLREMLSRSTTEFGFEPVSARSAEQAIRVLDEQAIDILLLDLNLPGMDGMQLLEHLHKREKRPEVIVLTGFGSLETARQAIRMDVVDFLTKPCALGDLEIALDRANRRLKREPVIAEPEPPHVPENATLQQLERAHILAALERHHGNRAAAAAQLGISERTLYYRLSEYTKS